MLFSLRGLKSLITVSISYIHMNPDHVLESYLVKIHYDIILGSALCSPNDLFLLRFYDEHFFVFLSSPWRPTPCSSTGWVGSE